MLVSQQNKTAANRFLPHGPNEEAQRKGRVKGTDKGWDTQTPARAGSHLHRGQGTEPENWNSSELEPPPGRDGASVTTGPGNETALERNALASPFSHLPASCWRRPLLTRARGHQAREPAAVLGSASEDAGGKLLELTENTSSARGNPPNATFYQSLCKRTRRLVAPVLAGVSQAVSVCAHALSLKITDAYILCLSNPTSAALSYRYFSKCTK